MTKTGKESMERTLPSKFCCDIARLCLYVLPLYFAHVNNFGLSNFTEIEFDAD